MTASPWATAAALLAADLKQLFGDRLVSVVAYGSCLEGDHEAPVTCLALVTRFDFADLEGCARRAAHWTRHRVAIPLVLREEELARSLDVFPLEYGDIIRAHERVSGPDPFERLAIDVEDLRRACEAQIKSHLLHLRQGFIEAGGRPHDVAALVRASAPAFASLLRSVARLAGASLGTRHEAGREGARAAGLDPSLVEQLLALERRGIAGSIDPARLFPEYLAAMEQLAHDVDTWRATTPAAGAPHRTRQPTQSRS